MQENNIIQNNFEWKIWIKLLSGCFCVLVILTVYFPYSLIPHPATLVFNLFRDLAVFSGENFWGLTVKDAVQFSSDSVWLYIHLCNLFLLSIAVSLVISIKMAFAKQQMLWSFMLIIIRYYLVLQLMIYGWNKIFKWQFYLPEPNTLGTPLGDLSKEMVFWSLIGSSYGYSVFAGIIEVVPAILLLFKRTRILGALISFGVLFQVFVMNISFDISVKFYSAFLFMLSAIILFENKRKILKGLGLLPEESRSDHAVMEVNFPLRIVLKYFVWVVIMGESFYMYFAEWNFNDDRAQRPKYHGAYLVVDSNDQAIGIKRIYIHRKGYLITEAADGKQKDFKFQLEESGNWYLTDAETNTGFEVKFIAQGDSLMQLANWPGKEDDTLKLRVFEWQKMALLQNGTHWYVE
jgi:hypothetical protein